MGYVFTYQNSCDINSHGIFMCQVDQIIKDKFQTSCRSIGSVLNFFQRVLSDAIGLPSI